jgi:hypothetical protein
VVKLSIGEEEWRVWTFSQPGHAVLRSEQRRTQDHLATLSGGSLDQASQEEDEEQEDEEDCLPQALAPDILPPEWNEDK